MQRCKRGLKCMKKKYSIKELSTILGCSVTAVSKKLKVDPDNPVIKRYKQQLYNLSK